MIITNKIDVSIIIVTYNSELFINDCLNSILKFTENINYEIIIFDNASSDNTVNLIKNNLKANIISIFNNINLGFAKACNIAVDKSNGEFLFFLNPDTFIVDNSIHKLFSFYKSNENIGALGSKIIDFDGCPSVSYGNFPSLTQEIFEYGFHKIFKSYYNNNLKTSIIDCTSDIKNVNYLIGANIFISKLKYFEVNGLNNDYFLYYEETELCYKLIKKGYKNVWYPNSTIAHFIGGSFSNKKFNYYIFYHLEKSKTLFFKNNKNYIYFLIVKFISFPKIIYKNRKNNIFKIMKIYLSTF